MFHKLRLKLTLINVAVMAILFLLFIAGTYFVMQAEIFNQSQQLMQMIAKDAGSGQPSDLHEHHTRTVQYFFVKTNAQGNPIESSADLLLQPNQISSLVHKVLQGNRSNGTLEWQDQSYTFLKAPLEKDKGYLIVFVSIEREREMLGALLLALLVAGLVSLALAFYGSLFLANKAMIPIKKSWQRQKDFVADASHELRTPLAVIQTNLELVMGNPEESVESQLNWLDNINIEAKRMTKLVNDLLFLARADSQQQLLHSAAFSLTSAVEDTIRSFKTLTAAKDLKLNSSVDSNVMFLGDENRMSQLLLIFLDNALKHTPAGGEIFVKLQNLSNEIAITVTDTGEGIAQEHLNKIFDRFYRVDKSRHRHEAGSGLGLAIADWIVQNYHGNIQVTSTPGQGTTFKITLPQTIETT